MLPIPRHITNSPRDDANSGRRQFRAAVIFGPVTLRSSPSVGLGGCERLVATARASTPDPIPNSAVKTLSADGTASQDAEEQVAARRSQPPPRPAAPTRGPRHHARPRPDPAPPRGGAARSPRVKPGAGLRAHNWPETWRVRRAVRRTPTPGPRLKPGMIRGPTHLLSAGWSSPVARQAHNLKVVGSNPTPATTLALPFPNQYKYFGVAPPSAETNLECPIARAKAYRAISTSSRFSHPQAGRNTPN
jgi:hypothetical protein